MDETLDPMSGISTPDRVRRQGLIRLRLDRRLAQEQLAYKAGVSIRTVVRAEHGWPIAYRSAYRIAKALGVEMEELFPEMAA
jgi:transcriptional regulator with XRE-family HTH domain